MPVSSAEIARLFSLTSRSHTPRQQLDALNRIIDAIQPLKYLEIGAFEGRSLLLFSVLASLKTQNSPFHATSIDTWRGGDEHREAAVPMTDVERCFDQVAASCSQFLHGNICCEKIKDFSSDGLIKIADRKNYYDLILIDASHKASDVLSDIVLAWPLLREGGVMILDDYTWIPQHSTHSPYLNAPKMAIDAFCGCYADQLVLLSNMPLLQLYVMKLSSEKIKSYAMALPEASLPSIFEDAGVV